MMPFVFPRRIFQNLHSVKQNFSSCGHLPPRSEFSNRLLFKVLNLSTSCQRSEALSEEIEGSTHQKGVPLKEVVADCVKRWFAEHLKAAEAGDPDEQAIVGQMFSSGYGVQKDPVKGKDWINRAKRKKKTPKTTTGSTETKKTPDDTYFFV